MGTKTVCDVFYCNRSYNYARINLNTNAYWIGCRTVLGSVVYFTHVCFIFCSVSLSSLWWNFGNSVLYLNSHFIVLLALASFYYAFQLAVIEITILMVNCWVGDEKVMTQLSYVPKNSNQLRR